MSRDKSSFYYTAKKLILGEDYRTAQQEAIEEEFLDEAIAFFKDIVDAKLDEIPITEDWYKNNFLQYSDNTDKKSVALCSGLNLKTIGNTKGSEAKEVVLDFANEHYEVLKSTINSLVENSEFNIKLELSFREVSVSLNSQESLIVINTLTVIRSYIRGGYYSSVGKGIEKPFMRIIVSLLEIDEGNFYFKDDQDCPDTNRDTDFFFVNEDGDILAVEIKLMGRGNPESADGAIARNANIFFAYKLSDSNKTNLSNLGIYYIELIGGNFLEKLYDVLEDNNVPFTCFTGSEDQLVEKIDEIIDNYTETPLDN